MKTQYVKLELSLPKAVGVKVQRGSNVNFNLEKLIKRINSIQSTRVNYSNVFLLLRHTVASGEFLGIRTRVLTFLAS